MDMSCTAGLGAGEERKEGGREGGREGKKGKNSCYTVLVYQQCNS